MHHSFTAASTLVVGAAALFLTPTSSAQTFDVYVSLSSDDTVAGATVRDEDILVHSDGEVARVALPSEALALWAGNAMLGDIDAFHDHGLAGPAPDSFYLSLLSNEHGFQDGDVLRFENGTLSVFIPEAAFGVVTGVDADLDVDAFQLDADGTVYFSLAEDETSTFLSGDTAGTIGDGDILCWVAGANAATIIFTESEVTAMVNQALGNATASGDTKGLARDPETGALLFCVQSPSSDDGTVISTANGGSLIGAHEEADFGFDGGGELDALTVKRTSYPTLAVEVSTVTAGDDVTVEVTGAPSNSAFLLVASTALSTGVTIPLGGWGGLVLVDDAVLTATLVAAPYLIIVTDALGRGTLTTNVPATLGPTEWVLQAIAPGPHLTSTNPLLLGVEQ